MKTILIIDDDMYIGDALEEALRREGYGVWRAWSGTEALLLLSGKRPDLILLDLMLPGLSGEKVLARIREEKITAGIPVIVLSAKADVTDKVELLMGGAEDYVTKPFDTRELLARIAVRLREGVSSGRSFLLTFEEITLNTEDRTVSVRLSAEKGSRSSGTGRQIYEVPAAGDAPADSPEASSSGRNNEIPYINIHLTRTEYAILKLLMQNPSQVVTKSLLLDRISEDTPDCTDGSLKMHVSNLRRKLREAGGKDYIEAVWGIGFKLRSESG